MQYSPSGRLWQWLADPALDARTRRELELMQDPERIAAHFGRNLFVGMGGLTARLDVGTSFLNPYTFSALARAVADFVAESGAGGRVLIGRDDRPTSSGFSHQLARTLASCGVPCALIDEYIAAPVFSYAIRKSGYAFGFYISATHHDRHCNGLLAYDARGCLLLPEQMKQLDERMQALDPLEGCTDETLGCYASNGAITIDTHPYFDEFIDAVRLQMDAPRDKTFDFPVACMAHIGCEGDVAARMLHACGFENVHVLPGTGEAFPMPYHRDEVLSESAREAFAADDARLLICVDSSLNNISAAVKREDGSIYPFTGSEIGIFLLDGRCHRLAAKNALPEHPVAAVSLIVSPMLHQVAQAYDIQVADTLVGFRYIVRVIEDLAADGRESDFVVGFEDNGSVLLNTVTRDKDALSTAAALCLLTQRAGEKGKTLYDMAQMLCERYGHFAYSRDQYSFEGPSGATRMYNLLRLLCHDIPTDIGGMRVLTLRDYERRTATTLDTLQTTSLPTDSAPIVALDLTAGTIVLRPASSKPLLRVYFAVSDTDPAMAEEKLAQMRRAMRTWIIQRS